MRKKLNQYAQKDCSKLAVVGGWASEVDGPARLKIMDQLITEFAQKDCTIDKRFYVRKDKSLASVSHIDFKSKPMRDKFVDGFIDSKKVVKSGEGKLWINKEKTDEQQARNTSLKKALAAITKSRPKEKFELVWPGRKIVKDKGPDEITVFVQDEWGLEGKWSDEFGSVDMDFA